MQPTERKCTTSEEILAVGLEIAVGSWKLALQDGRHERASVSTVKAAVAGKRLEELCEVVEATKRKWKLVGLVRVVVVYEAGQEGFWISRALREKGYEVLVVDAASLLVSRQKRRAKTDRLDAIGLVMSLRGWLTGERDRMRVLHEPSVEAEAQRQLVRERGQLQKECGQHRDRVSKLLRTLGCWDSEGELLDRLRAGELRCHDGAALPQQLQGRLQQECERWELARAQLARLEASMVQQLPEAQRERVKQLMGLKAVGWVGAVRLVLELYWRNFANRRQVGASVGLVPQPYDSGETRIDQGISKQGNRRVRALLIEMSWMWLRYQPGSALARWFVQRTQGAGKNKRMRRIAIVALARRLAIALWRYLEQGVLPEGALLKAPAKAA